jgi:hypothetical protein
MFQVIGYIVLYVLSAVFISFVFKFIVGLIEFVVLGLLFAIVGLTKSHRGRSIEDRIAILWEQHPKMCFTYTILQRATIGAWYSLIIANLTFQFIDLGGNRWVYTILSLIWGLTLLNYAEAFQGILLSSCLLSLILLHLGFGILGVLAVWLLTILISVGYYHGRIDILREQMMSEKHLGEDA